jgi:hypothetical protein
VCQCEYEFVAGKMQLKDASAFLCDHLDEINAVRNALDDLEGEK